MEGKEGLVLHFLAPARLQNYSSALSFRWYKEMLSNTHVQRKHSFGMAPLHTIIQLLGKTIHFCLPAFLN